MKNVVKVLVFLVILGVVGYFIFNKAQDEDSVVSTSKEKVKKTIQGKDYTIIPHEEIFANNALAKKQLEELKGRFENSFKTFSSKLKKDNVKLVYCWLTTEVGNAETASQRKSKPFIKQLCLDNGVEFVDFSDLFIGQDPFEITHMPKDGHLNEKGVELITGRLAEIVERNKAHRSNLSFNPSDRPRYLGDLEPYEDLIVDGGKGIPYKMQTNASGLRLSREVRFDNEGVRVLLMGDSGFYFPFVDNDETATHLLQKQFPEAEILNSAGWGYTITDYISQYQDAVKYTEPDVIILQSSGDDIADLYFTHQRSFSRTKRKEKYEPSKTEKEFYSALEKMN